MKLSLPEARILSLQSQGLFGILPQRGKQGVLECVEQLGYVQIDTISVVARAHHHTLWSRTKDYREAHLQILLEEKKLFEYWSHAASYLPMRDYRYSLFRKQIYAKGKTHWFGKTGQDLKLKKYVIDRIKAEGGLQSKDFEHTGKGARTWYEWKPAKRALEQLFMEGRLMVAARKGFQKVYDLSERVIPEGIDTAMPSEKEYAEHLILNAIRANGLVTLQEISYLRGYAREGVVKHLKRMLKDGTIREAEVEHSGKYYMYSGELKTIPEKPGQNKSVHLLGPFDNSVIQRKRLQTLFQFDFLIECYVPEPKRKYGYFCLPVLEGDCFVARLDPKADRTEKTFYVRKFYPEKGWKPTESFAGEFALQLKAYASFCGCKRIKCGKDTPGIIRNKLGKEDF